MALLNVDKLSVHFGDVGSEIRAVDRVSYSVNQGEVVGIVGESGSGKSVLIKCIVGLLQHDEGSIKVGEHELTDISEEELIKVRRKIGFLFQGAALYDSMTVRENLTFALTRLKEKFSDQEITTKI